ncbi:hypothetical protein DFA_07411 [Cavenderia fasciculata]|uniref:EGF-like domain-containing protein n=1 Tax=Cavenderia fasciculata TaxID=261658 RepID=F4PWC4_CACFS|nr:uncharacterized protein DFA_07411 [Cavenderia fasciculata]EGG20288.1 hypothetical protein DFA_07411 [Cavenderia fasciculata]|eukprot:XP_004367271.1 hypothetical protein DFA_07411 [Cavenderia fasciculata]
MIRFDRPYLLLLFIFIILGCSIQHVQSQPTLPQAELESLVWLSKQFKLGWPITNITSVCYTIWGVTCQLYENDTVFHVTFIERVGDGVFQGTPDPIIAQKLEFPMLEQIFITCGVTVSGYSVENNSTLLSYMTGLPLLETIYISKCNNLHNPPITFPYGLPSLTTLQLDTVGLIHVPSSFFNTSSIITLNIIPNNELQTIDFAENSNVLYFRTTIPVLPNESRSIHIKQNHFLPLSLIALYSPNSGSVSINVEAQVTNLVVSCPDSTISYLNSTGAQSLTLNGLFDQQNVYFESNKFPNLNSLRIQTLEHSDRTTQLQLYITASKITNINLNGIHAKVMALPLLLETFSFATQNYIGDFLSPYDLLLGCTSLFVVTFDYMTQLVSLGPSVTIVNWSYMSNTLALPDTSNFFLPNVQYQSVKMASASTSVTGPVPQFLSFRDRGSFDVSKSTNVNGVVPDSYCNLYDLNIESTSITDVPTCFKCNYAGFTGIIKLPQAIKNTIPLNYFCPTRLFTSTYLFTVEPLDSTQQIELVGENLGYGHTNITVIHPMTNMGFTIPNVHKKPRSLMITFGNLKNYGGSGINSVTHTISWYLFYITSANIIPIGNTYSFELIGFFDVSQPNATIMGSFNCQITSFNTTYILCSVAPNPPLVLASLIDITLSVYTNNTVYTMNLPNLTNPIVIKNTEFTQSMDGTTYVVVGYDTILINQTLDPFTYEIQVDGYFCSAERLTPQFLGCLLPTILKDQQQYTVKVSKLNNAPWNSVSLPFYQIFKQAYPYVTSIPEYYTNDTIITIYGNFGTDHFDSSIITIQSVNWTYVNGNASFLTCQYNLDTPITPGVKSLVINTQGWIFKRDSMIVFKTPPNNNGSSTTTTTTSSTTTDSQECQCGLHGYCIVLNGIRQCQCTDGYSGDQCQNAPYPGGEMTINTTTPSASFNTSDGESFSFNLVSIQELGMDGQIIKEMTTFQWTVIQNISMDENNSQRQLRIVTYNLNSTNNNNNQNQNQNNVSIQVILQQSNYDRIVEFAGVNSSLVANDIKLAMNISSWIYESTLNSLRVVFQSDIGQGEDCNGNKINPTIASEFDSQSVEYLQIVKGNIIFNGRFVDRVLSDRRVSYSRNEIVSLTNSSISIGIHLPFANFESIIDPDFSLLVSHDSDATSNCNRSTSSNTWKIIVGVVVGGIAAIALIGAAAKYLHFKHKKNRQDQHLQAKLKRLND